MRFTYTYRSSDGQRHSAEIEAESRDAAFEAIRRELGVKPIKVTAAGDAGGRVSSRAVAAVGDGRPPGGKAVAYVLFVAFVFLAVVGGIWWLAGRRRDAPYQVMTPQGPVTYTVATPLPRQMIPGDRARIDSARRTAFRSSAEIWLARFAEPGRTVENGFNHVERAERVEGRNDQKDPTRSIRSARLDTPAHEDFVACLKEPIRIASTDFTEVVDLKRIVTGMKREMRAYLAGGGSVDGYLAELEKRQRLEISYRERAEQKLNEMLSNHDSSPGQSNEQAIRQSNNPTIQQSNNDNLRAAYAYWLKANATLKSMGIYELPLPDALHGYQAGLYL